jgi:hypothetical protein
MSRTRLVSAAAVILFALATGACDKGPKTSAHAQGKTDHAAMDHAAMNHAAMDHGAGAAAPTTAAGGNTFGAGVKLTSSTPIASILAEPKAFAGKSVRVEGMIVDVCPKRGCWMDLAGQAPGEKLRFKVVDGEMVFPMDAKGKYAVAEGVVAVDELSLEDSVAYAKYQAEEVGKPFDPASVTAPITVVKLDGTGAILRDKP